jgi:hypothetical protein
MPVSARLASIAGHMGPQGSLAAVAPPSAARARAAAVSLSSSSSYMLVIRNGTVIDGSGASRYSADIAIGRDGKIACIGKDLPGQGAREIDAAGKLVTPGFVDVHTVSAAAQQKMLRRPYVADPLGGKCAHTWSCARVAL